MGEEEESSFSGNSPQRKQSPPGSNLKRFHGATGLLEFVQRGRSFNGNSQEPYLESDDDRFFDSSDYRCCCSLFHAKIGTFVFCTWIFHEIVLGTIYLLTQLENGSQLNSRMAILLACRFIQLPSMAVLYVGLWRHRRYLLLPFALVQVTLGTFVDMSTLMLLLEQMEASGSTSPFLFETANLKWLNLVIPLLVYTIVMVSLMWVLYKCFVFLKARSAHDEKRRLDKQKEEAKLQHPLIERTMSDRYADCESGTSEPPDTPLVPRRNGNQTKAATSPPEMIRINADGGDAPDSASPSRNSSPPALVLMARAEDAKD